MSTHNLGAQMVIPQTNLDVPVQIQVGGGGSTTSTTSAPRRGWVWGVLGTLLALLILGILGLVLLGVWREAPVAVNYSSDLGRIEQKIDAVSNGTATMIRGLGDLEGGVSRNTDILKVVARRGDQTGQAIDKIGGVTYDASGNVTGTQTLAEAIAAADRAAASADLARKARSRVVRVEVPGASAPVDLSGLEARFDSIERALSARPTLERVNNP
jgi:hypothetical protein